MQPPFDEKMGIIADNMGIALYQRFTPVHASLFLRCHIEKLTTLQSQGKIDCIQIDDENIEFFGYQLLQYLLGSVTNEFAPSPANSQSPDRIVRAQEVQNLTGLSRTTLWRLERRGDFPARVTLSSSNVGWRLSEIQRWIQSRS